jgi:hypothetical protein
VALVGGPCVDWCAVVNQGQQARLVEGVRGPRVQRLDPGTDHAVVEYPAQPVLTIDELLDVRFPDGIAFWQNASHCKQGLWTPHPGMAQ